MNDFEDDQSGLEDRFLKDLDFCLRDVESPDPIPLPANPDEIPLPNDGETRPGSPEPGPSFQSPVFKRPVARTVIFMTTFFIGGDKSGRSITAVPDKIFTQTFFEGIDEGSNCGLVGVSNTSGNRKCPKNRKKVKKQ